MRNLKRGARTQLGKTLPGLDAKNAASAFEEGEMMTDNIACWVDRKFVAGPFRRKPYKEFRVNPLMAVRQRTKVRPILNLSSPEGGSFNDAVHAAALKKLTMSTAREFGQAIRRAGPRARMAKYDINDAYKLIPGVKSQWRHFGFKWLGRYFFDVSTVFGSCSAPANFDYLPETIVNIVCSQAELPRSMVYRQLDDVPVVAPAGTGRTERFAQKYVEICAALGVPLAEECPDKEKAFGPGMRGTVLGVKFDTSVMTWSWAADKVERAAALIDQFCAKRTCSLKEAQKLHGKLNDLAQMCEFMLGFRYHLIKLLAAFGDAKSDEQRLVTTPLKADLAVWRAVLGTAYRGLPIPDPPCGPPITAMTFISDAAGAAFTWADGVRTNSSNEGDRGVASIGHVGNRIFFAGGMRWPLNLITEERDSEGKLFGSKSAALECVGLLIPIMCVPQLLVNKYVHLTVDNSSLTYAWEKKYMKNDEETSILLRCLHMAEAFLGSKLHVSYRRRMSDDMSVLVDHLSRTETTTEADLARIAHLRWETPGSALMEWVKNPRPDWSLPEKVVQDIAERLCL